MLSLAVHDHLEADARRDHRGDDPQTFRRENLRQEFPSSLHHQTVERFWVDPKWAVSK